MNIHHACADTNYKSGQGIFAILAGIIIAFSGTLLLPAFLTFPSLSFTNSISAILVFALLFMLVRHAYQQQFSLRKHLFSQGLGILFSFMTAYGRCLEVQSDIPFLKISFLLAIFVFAHIIGLLISCLWSYLEQMEFRLRESALRQQRHSLLSRLFSSPLAIMGILLLCWLPCYLSTFPGAFRYDATEEFNQLTTGFRGDFPFLHSFLITGILSGVHALTGSYNAGIAVYTIAQMIFAAFLLARILCTLYKQHIHKGIIGGLCVYYALFPVIHLLVTCTARDMLFSILLTYLMFLLYQLRIGGKKYMRSWKKIIELALVIVMTLLSRNNNSGLLMPIALLVLCLVIIAGASRGTRIRALILSGASIGCYVILSLLLSWYCQPYIAARTNSALTLCSQSIARAYLEEKESWTEEETATLQKYMKTEVLNYTPENGDSTKWNLQIKEGETGDFLVFWAKMGLKYPSAYLNAILANTRQMWYPSAVVDGYQEYNIASYANYDKSYFSFRDYISSPGERIPMLSAVQKFYEQIGLMFTFEKIPVISMLFSIGFQFWFLLNTLFYASYRRCKHLLLPLAVLLIYTLVSAFVPLVLLRYFSALFLAFPLLLAFTLQPSLPPKNMRASRKANSISA